MKNKHFSDKCTYLSGSFGTYTTRSANMKNSSSAYTTSNANSTPTCETNNKSGIDTALVHTHQQGQRTIQHPNPKHQTAQTIRKKLNRRISEQARARKLVQRAGFEPANPYGKGCLMRTVAQHSNLSPSPLTWLGDRCLRQQTFMSFLLIVSRF